MRATHPQIGIAGPEGSTLHGRIDEYGTEAYWREQTDHCNPLVETQLGRPLKCTRFAGRGDINSVVMKVDLEARIISEGLQTVVI